MENNTEIKYVNNDESVDEFERLYGNYVANDLVPQLSKLAAFKVTSSPITFNITNNDKANERIQNIYDNADFNSAIFVAEERMSALGNAVIVFEKISDEEFNIYVPTTSITRVDPSSGELNYLQIIRYIQGGDLINVVSEIHTLKETSYQFHGYDSMADAERDVNNAKKNGGKLKGKEKTEEKIKEEHPELNGQDFSTRENKLGFIQAAYFENIPTTDKRGEPDILLTSRYVPLLNKTMVRFYWELEFNKSKFIEEEEMGQNIFGSSFRTAQNQAMVENNYVKKANNFGLAMGSAGSGYQYFETTNQNLVNLIQLFNYFIKKLWEQSGQHQSGSDIGKQISDLQAEMERGAEHLRFKNKILRRKRVLKNLLWKMFITMGDFGDYGEKPDFNKSDININMTYAKVDIEKNVIENEIMKLQSNLTNREEAIARIKHVSSDEDIAKLSEKYLNDNLDDIKAQQIENGEAYKAKPVQVQNPSMNNPQGSTNNQSKKFNTQKQEAMNKGGEK